MVAERRACQISDQQIKDRIIVPAEIFSGPRTVSRGGRARARGFGRGFGRGRGRARTGRGRGSRGGPLGPKRPRGGSIGTRRESMGAEHGASRVGVHDHLHFVCREGGHLMLKWPCGGSGARRESKGAEHGVIRVGISVHDCLLFYMQQGAAS